MSTPIAECGLIDQHTNILIFPLPALANKFSTGLMDGTNAYTIDIPDNANFAWLSRGVTTADISISSRSVWMAINAAAAIPTATPNTAGTAPIPNPPEIIQIRRPLATGNYLSFITNQLGVDQCVIFATKLLG